MKKFRVLCLALLGAMFGLTSCDAPAFMYKIPGLNKLLLEKQESQKDEKKDEDNKPSGDQSGDQGGQDGGETQPQVGDPATFDFTKITETSGQVGAYSFTTALGTNPSNALPAYNADKQELRLYIGNTITFTSNALITSIVFDANTCTHSNANGTLSADKGSLNQFTWTGSATSVTFSVASGKQVHINEIKINSGSSQDGGDTEERSEQFLELKELILDIACDLYQCEESEITFADEESSAANSADVTFRDTEDLVYVSLYGYSESGTLAENVEYLETYLPNGAEKDADLSDEGDGYVDYYYDAGDLYYSIYAYDDEYNGAAIVVFYIDIVLEAHLTAYFAYLAE